MIWGLTLEPGKQYTRVTGGEIQLSMATLESRDEFGSTSDLYSHVVLRTSRNEYLLCTLVHGTTFQQSLDLKLRPTETVTFSVQGTSIVYLTGYSMEDAEVEDQIEVEEFDVEDQEDASIGLGEEEYGTNETTDTGMSGEPPEQPMGEGSMDAEVDLKPIINTVIKQEPQEQPENTQVPAGFPPSGFSVKQEEDHEITEISDDAWDQEEEEDPSVHIQVSLGQDRGLQGSGEGSIPLGQPRVPNEHYQPFIMQSQNAPQGQLPAWSPAGPVPPSPATLLHQRRSPNPQTAGPGRGVSPGRPSTSQLAGNNGRQHTLFQQRPAVPSQLRYPTTPKKQTRPTSSSGTPPQAAAAAASLKLEPMQCDFCEFVAQGILHLKRHRRTHTQEKQYNCSICGKSLYNFNSKLRHERSHLGVRPFPCRYCPKTFTQAHHRKKHEKHHELQGDPMVQMPT